MRSKISENEQENSVCDKAEDQKTAVILPIDEYEETMEDLHLGRVAFESKDLPRRSVLEIVQEMRDAGEIDYDVSVTSLAEKDKQATRGDGRADIYDPPCHRS